MPSEPAVEPPFAPVRNALDFWVVFYLGAGPVLAPLGLQHTLPGRLCILACAAALAVRVRGLIMIFFLV